MNKITIGSYIVILVIIGFLIYSLIAINTLKHQTTVLENGLASTTEAFTQNMASTTANLLSLQSQINGLSSTLYGTQQNIDAVKNQVGAVEQTVGTVTGTVGDLQKLAQLDPELLKKYSKVYFLNENFVPAHLTELPTEYAYSNTRTEQFLTEAWPFLKNMIDTAKQNGIELYIKPGYRSFDEQQSLKSAYKTIYGAGTANSFSADQGYSEHQLGTTVDIITSGLDGQLNDSFDKTEAYKWLLDNAQKFGFELSYPKGNDYYVYEPWHWRFVGVKLATMLKDNKINFYDTDQREIDKYLINIFDQN